MHKSLSRLFDFQHSRYSMRALRHGKREKQNNNKDKGNTYMSKLRKTMVKLIYEIGDQSGCHQMPERSFFYKGHQFPVCARCTGVAIGQLAAIIANFFMNIPFRISALFLAVMGLDWSLQEFKVKESTNIRRLFTGILGGFGLFNCYCIAAKKIIKSFTKITMVNCRVSPDK